MTRRFEAGPALVALGAIVLLVSLFLEWYIPGITAWDAFEVFDVLLTALAVAALAAALGLLAPELAYIDRAWLPVTVGAVVVIVASQLLDPPPAAADTERGTGGWLALAGAGVMVAGTILTFGSVRFAVEVQRRDPRRRVAAVDARREGERTGADRPAAEREPWADAPDRAAPAEASGDARKDARDAARAARDKQAEAAEEHPRAGRAGPHLDLATQPLDPPEPRPSRGGPLLGAERRDERGSDAAADESKPDREGESS
jgi:hypothetical protein